MRKASCHPTLSSMANSGCLLLSGSGMLPHSLQCPPAFLYLPELGDGRAVGDKMMWGVGGSNSPHPLPPICPKRAHPAGQPGGGGMWTTSAVRRNNPLNHTVAGVFPPLHTTHPSAGAAARLREMTAREQKGNRLRGRLSPPLGGAGSILPQDDVTFLLPSIRIVVPLF
ncbi:hypothetical protein JOQ06_010232, partial [Pogonophryne albipinna]